jgi:hypothetical protein
MGTPILGLTVPDPNGEDDVGEWPTIAAQGLVDLENTLILNLDSRTRTGVQCGPDYASSTITTLYSKSTGNTGLTQVSTASL